MRLQNKVALITGSGNGIGRASRAHGTERRFGLGPPRHSREQCRHSRRCAFGEHVARTMETCD